MLDELVYDRLAMEVPLIAAKPQLAGLTNVITRSLLSIVQIGGANGVSAVDTLAIFQAVAEHHVDQSASPEKRKRVLAAIGEEDTLGWSNERFHEVVMAIRSFLDTALEHVLKGDESFNSFLDKLDIDGDGEDPDAPETVH